MFDSIYNWINPLLQYIRVNFMSLRIGVLSDTHISMDKALPGVLAQYFKNTDHIIHAGDIKTRNVIKQLEEFAPVTAVAGNADSPDLHREYGEKKILNLGKFTFGVVHGDGAKGRTIDRVIKCFQNCDIDCLIFGHSHNPICMHYLNRLLFNPGSPTVRRRNPYCSFGIIELDQFINPAIIYFDSNGKVVDNDINK